MVEKGRREASGDGHVFRLVIVHGLGILRGHCIRDLHALVSPFRTAGARASLLATWFNSVVVPCLDLSQLVWIEGTTYYCTMSSATKAQSQKIFEKLKTKPANKVYLHQVTELHHEYELSDYRYASTAVRRTQRGLQYHSVYTCASTALPITVTWGCIFHL